MSDITAGAVSTRSPLPLDQLFRPRSIAVVGASSSGGGPGFIGGMQAMGFAGPIYPVNPKATEIAGLKCYPSLYDCPTDVDYVISSVPARVAPELVEGAIAKNARLIHFFTAGFSETGDPERIELERRAIGRALSNGIRVLGPNCMGLYVPGAGLSFMTDVPSQPGDIAMISQSGANASEFVHRAMVRGGRFSTVVSYGNGADLRDAELLEYVGRDPDTGVVAMYIEGLKDGRAFFKALRQVAPVTPVIILKGGRTEAGGRATRSHTGSLAGSIQVFDAACRQAGAIRVTGLDELVDMAVAFRFLAPDASPGARPLGDGRVGMVLSGGGTSVLATDDLATAGLDVPPLPEAARARLAEFIPVAGTSIRNPVDMNMFSDNPNLVPALTAIASAENIDILYFHASFNWNLPGDHQERADVIVRALAETRAATGKPFVVVVEPAREMRNVETEHLFTRLCWEHRLPVFPSSQRLASALSRVRAWYDERADDPFGE